MAMSVCSVLAFNAAAQLVSGIITRLSWSRGNISIHVATEVLREQFYERKMKSYWPAGELKGKTTVVKKFEIRSFRMT